MIKKEIIIKRLGRLPDRLKEIVFLARDLAKQEGMGVYLVGGFVRDLILGVDNFDLDFVVEKNGIDFAHKLSELLKGHMIKHRAFNTATITTKDGFKIDVATSRSEVYPEPAALPVVSVSDIGDDLYRRDFTINALACHIDKDRYGEIVDMFNGAKDLKTGSVRVMHGKSFIDDPTRIIRAVRFEQRLGFQIDRDTLSLIKAAKKLKMLEKVQKHRIRDEIILIFKEKNAFKILRRINQIYNLTFIEDTIKLNKKHGVNFKKIDKGVIWFRENLSQKRGLDTWLMYLVIFLYQLDIKRLNHFVKTYAFPKGDSNRIISFKKVFKKIDKVLSKRNIPVTKLHKLLDPLAYEVIVLVYSISNSTATKDKIKEFFFEHHHKKLLINGRDLLLIGVKPGPEFRNIFNKVFKAKIQGKVVTYQEELELVKKLINKK